MAGFVIIFLCFCSNCPRVLLYIFCGKSPVICVPGSNFHSNNFVDRGGPLMCMVLYLKTRCTGFAPLLFHGFATKPSLLQLRDHLFRRPWRASVSSLIVVTDSFTNSVYIASSSCAGDETSNFCTSTASREIVRGRKLKRSCKGYWIVLPLFRWRWMLWQVGSGQHEYIKLQCLIAAPSSGFRTCRKRSTKNPT